MQISGSQLLPSGYHNKTYEPGVSLFLVVILFFIAALYIEK